jgi:hypothetical protein
MPKKPSRSYRLASADMWLRDIPPVLELPDHPTAAQKQQHAQLTVLRTAAAESSSALTAAIGRAEADLLDPSVQAEDVAAELDALRVQAIRAARAGILYLDASNDFFATHSHIAFRHPQIGPAQERITRLLSDQATRCANPWHPWLQAITAPLTRIPR